MDPEHRKKLKDPSIIARLVPAIDFDVLGPLLVERGVLTGPMLEDIQGHSEDERTFRLLQRLPKRGPLAYNRLLQALLDTRMMEAHKVLTGTDVTEAYDTLTGQAPRSRERSPQSQGETIISSAVRSGDGPVAQHSIGEHGDAELKVRPAKEWKNGDDMYKMMRKPRGTCVIINNRDFRHKVLPQRKGSELDVQRMDMLFRALYFDCIVRIDQTKEEIMSLLLQVAASQQRHNVDCLVVILMSHGSHKDIIYDVMGECVDTEELIAMFNNVNCPALQGKPKLFFIQACRGEKYDSGTSGAVDTADAATLPEEMASVKLSAESAKKRVPTVSDMFIAYATLRGHVSHKNEVIGSWFLSTVFRVFCDQAWNTHLDKMMRRVTDEMKKRVSHDGCHQTTNVDLRGWSKKLYFNPGLSLEQAASS